MKKNIWILNHYAGGMMFDHGGRHYNFAKYLKRSQYEPVVFCANSNHRTGDVMFETDALWHEHLAEEIGVPFVCVKARAYTGNGKQRIFNMLDFYFNVKKAAKEYAAKNGKPDVIYASSVHPLTLVAGIQLAKKFGVKCICEVRDLWPESIVVYSTRFKKTNPLIQLLYLGEKWIYQKADQLIFTMEGAYDYIRAQGWEKAIPSAKVHFINNGVDSEVFNYNKEHYPVEDADLVNPDFFKVGYTGSIRKANNIGLLLDVAKSVKDPKVRFLIWGSGDELPMLQQRVQDENITNVVFKGRVDKSCIPYIISKLDVNYVDPFDEKIARYGISSNKLFEYFAAEKPILMSASGEYNPADNFHCAVVCQPNAESLLEGLEQILHMPADTFEAVCANARKASDYYSFSNLTEKLIEIIEAPL